MKISCIKNNLQAGLSITSHLSTKNIQLPILNNVLIVAKNGNLRLTSTNLEIAVSCLVRGKVEEEGEITVPAKLFHDLITLLKSEKINLWSENQVLYIETDDYKTKINGLSSSEFPLVPSVIAEKFFVVPAEDFHCALSQAVFAVATNESRPELSGVLLRFKTNELVLAATDSYRLAEKKIKINNELTDEVSAIIPSRSIQEVYRILSVYKDFPESSTDVRISLSENQAVFTFDSVELISRVIEGSFPDYQQIIPQTFQTETKINREDLINAVRTASLFSRSGLFDVALTFDPAGVVKVAAADTTKGENTAKVGASVVGKENGVTLNYRYLLDGVQSLNTNEILFQMVDGSNPCLLRPVDIENQHLYIIMPIRQ